MEQKEIWKDINGYEGYYQVSNHGRVKSLKRKIWSLQHGGHWQTRREKVKKIKTDGDGYKFVGLSANGVTTNYRIHRLVGSSFSPNPQNKETINHKDGNKANNKVSNLEWATRSENCKHAYKIGIASNKGAQNPSSKLTESDVYFIKILLNHGVMPLEIADMYDVARRTISAIKCSTNWSHVTL